jgi:hypothetical protein
MNTKFSIDRWSRLAGLQLLREADEKEIRLKSSIEGFAVGQFDVHGDITIVLYDPKKMKDAIEGLNDFDVVAKSPVGEMPAAIMGMIRISPPFYGSTGDENSCHGAWEVVRSGVRSRGEGIGGLLYRLAAAASPTKKLMPDRRDVSPHAQKIWQSKYNKMSPEKKKSNVFDDESNTKTEDPNDDCLVHDYSKEEGPGSNPLNYAFDEFGGNVNIDALTTAHQDFMDELSWSLPSDINVDKLFFQAASKAFHEMTD